MPALKIEPTTKDDLEFIAQIFDDAITYQIRNNFPIWKGHDKKFILKDIERNRQYKILIDDKIACVFSVFYSDDAIWKDRDKGDGLYLNRMVVNPQFKGQRLFGKVLDRAKEHAAKRNIPFVRMDIWANNVDMISYYKSFGFEVVDRIRTTQNESLPASYWDIDVVLLEAKV